MLYNNLTKQYKISKTLRFELRPVGKTLENIKERGFISSDEERAKNYNKIKTLINEFHKYFIQESLQSFQFSKESLENWEDSYKNKTLIAQKKRALIGQLSEHFKKHTIDMDNGKDEIVYKKIFEQDLINKYLDFFIKKIKPELNTEENANLLKSFKSFTTYFAGFNENRKNIYSNDGRAGSIGCRLISDNLPKFYDNCTVYEKRIMKIQGSCDLALANLSAEELSVFEFHNFNNFLTQKGIEKYNLVLGGLKKEDGSQIEGINQKINLYNQAHSKEEEYKKIPQLKTLYKQILSDTETSSFVLDQFDSDDQTIDAVKGYIDLFNKIRQDEQSIFNVIASLKSLDGIYIRNGEPLTTLSNNLLDDWGKITALLEKECINNALGKEKAKLTKKPVKDCKKHLKNLEGIPLQDINNVAKGLIGETGLIQHIKTKLQERLDGVDLALKNFGAKSFSTNLKTDIEGTAILKAALDSLKGLHDYLKIFKVEDADLDKSVDFYDSLDNNYEELKQIIPLYNKVRNYITTKIYSDEKIKVTFNNYSLLSGWDKNKEKDSSATILRKEGLYYLAILTKDNKEVFKDWETNDEVKSEHKDSEDFYEKMNYKQFSVQYGGLGGFVRKCFNSVKDWKPAENLLTKPTKEGRTEKTIIVNDAEATPDKLPALIDCYKDFLNKYEKNGFKYSSYGFIFKDSKDYEKLSDFFNDVSKQCYKIDFSKIAASYIDNFVEEGKLYLFQIYNKDFSPNSKGKPNLHTIYFKALFEKENLKNIVYKLDGGAEMFWRKASIERKITHPKNQPIRNKQDPAKESKFDYDLIKDKRFTEDKFALHTPITINFTSDDNPDINYTVNDNIRKAENIKVIGIDRGERNLLYVVIVDGNGKILEQFSLNNIVNNYNDNTHNVDYHKLLAQRQVDRDKSRKNWQEISNISKLKDGYLSQCVHKIVDLAIKNEAAIALEDLNFGFKNSRNKIEKQVYQKFEKALIEKLNFVINKEDADPSAPGGKYNGLQLTKKFKSFKELGRQTGILFYIPAWNTSNIDPTTGFIDFIKPKYESVEQSKKLFGKFKDIRFNAKENYYEFIVENSYDFIYDAKKKSDRNLGEKIAWDICSFGTRIYRSRDENGVFTEKEVNLTEELKGLFDDEKYAFDSSKSLKENILEQTDATFFKRLIHLLKLTLQLRNTKKDKDEDYILSPVKNSCGEFFDSRKKISTLPIDADANGAYNIARKGLLAIRQIKESSADNIKFNISNKEWLDYVYEQSK